MNDLWQNLAALAIVALAGAYLLRQVWRTFAARPTSACGGCTGCSASSALVPSRKKLDDFASRRSQPSTLITVNQLLKRPEPSGSDFKHRSK
jgi:hypothetical protein